MHKEAYRQNTNTLTTKYKLTKMAAHEVSCRQSKTDATTPKQTKVWEKISCP